MDMLLYIQHHEKHIVFEVGYSSKVASGAVDSAVACQTSKEGKPFQFFFRK